MTWTTLWVILGSWLAWDVLVLAVITLAGRRRDRRRPPCPVIDLQEVAMQRASRRATARGQSKGAPHA